MTSMVNPYPERRNIAMGDFVYRSPKVPVFVTAENCTLVDTESNCYLDCEAANGTAAFGFDRRFVDTAAGSVGRLSGLPSFCESDVRLNLATDICQRLRRATGLDGRVAFELGGAQAIELAMKVAHCNNSNSSQVVCFEGGYHGRSIFTSQLSASHRYRSINGDWRIPVTRLPYPDCDDCRFSQIRATCALQCVSYVRQLASKEYAGLASSKGDEILAMIFEPVFNAGGLFKPDKTYLEEAIGIFRSKGALVIADETFCGFYRTGLEFGFEHFDIKPDIVVLGKALTNGIVPLSCVWAREPLMAPHCFPPGTHSATYANNVFAMGVARAVLNRFTSWSNIKTDVALLESRLANIVEDLRKRFDIIRSTSALGGTARLLLRTDSASSVLSAAREIALSNPIDGFVGVILASTGMASNVVGINPPLTISASELSVLHLALTRALAKLNTH